MADPTDDSTDFVLAADLPATETDAVLGAVRVAVSAGPLRLEAAAPEVRVPCLQILLATLVAGRSAGHSVTLGPNARAALARYGAEGAA